MMNMFYHFDGDSSTADPFQSVYHPRNRIPCRCYGCIICGSKAIGMNFGAPTCAPCKAFFRRNARRRELLESACQHDQIPLADGMATDINTETAHCLQIRRCSSCRLRRCFSVGMKEELVRTEEENVRHKQLVDRNRKRREAVKQQQDDNLARIPQFTITNTKLLSDIDWCHLSNIVSGYESQCLKAFIHQRGTMTNCNETTTIPSEVATLKHVSMLPVNLTLSLSSFLRSLPAFHSLSYSHRAYLCKTNIRPLIFPNNHELKQCCFSEPWQISLDKAAWSLMCGPELYERFLRTEKLAAHSLITDPIVTRLWLVVLFFSTSLYSYHDQTVPKAKLNKTCPSIEIQNAYAKLLWKYLVHRHGDLEAARIYANLIYVFLSMIRVGAGVNIRLRTVAELIPTHETLTQLVSLDINHV